MISPARSAAFEVLRRVESTGEFCDRLLNSELLAGIDARDRDLATELCFGSLRSQAALDDVLGKCSARPWEDVDAGVRVLLRMSLYQLWHTDRIPDHALVNDAVEIAKHRVGRGSSAFINGILRRLARERPWENERFDISRPDWVRVSLPEWLWNRWSDRFGREQALKYAMSLNRPPQCAAWSSRRPGIETGSSGIPSPFVPDAVLFEEKKLKRGWWIQDEASQLIPHLLGPLAGRKLWDCCAAPGGKCGILSFLVGEEGFVAASDLKRSRAMRMREALSGLPWKRHQVLLADARAESPFRNESFDVVLADVPCSGLGTLRRNPEIRWRFSPEKLAALQEGQISILDAVSRALRPGGTLLYSTCSTEPEENEQVVDAFLESHTDFGLKKPGAPPGIGQWLDSRGMLRTFPCERLWDGFFAALMYRFT